MNARINLPPELLEPVPAFEPFRWTTPEADAASTQNQLAVVSRARDVAYGVANIMEMLEQEELGEGCEGEDGRPIPKLFNPCMRGNLQRLAITSLQMLGDSLAKAIEHANSNARKRADT